MRAGEQLVPSRFATSRKENTASRLSAAVDSGKKLAPFSGAVNTRDSPEHVRGAAPCDTASRSVM